MTPQAVAVQKAALDVDLSKWLAGPPINVAFGIDLFNEFVGRRYAVQKQFENPAFPEFPWTFWTYIDNVMVPNWEIPTDTYKVGLGGFRA